MAQVHGNVLPSGGCLVPEAVGQSSSWLLSSQTYLLLRAVRTPGPVLNASRAPMHFVVPALWGRWGNRHRARVTQLVGGRARLETQVLTTVLSCQFWYRCQRPAGYFQNCACIVHWFSFSSYLWFCSVMRRSPWNLQKWDLCYFMSCFPVQIRKVSLTWQ